MKEKTSLIYKLLLITIFFNWWFPKSGIKLSGIPLTVGIVLFIILTILEILVCLRKKMYLSNMHLAVLISIIYFAIRMIIAYLKGIELSNLVGYAIPLVAFPLIFFIITNEVKNKEKYEKIMNIFVYGFFFLCIYSFLQSIFGIAKVDIPGLSVNYTDYKELGKYWFMEKSNGTSMENIKIVSTYQNGNLFGENLLIIFPIIYDYLISKDKKKMATISLIFLIISELITLSRTCWIGLVLFLIFRLVFSDNAKLHNVFKKLLMLMITIILFFLILKYIPSVSNRLFKTDFNTFMKGSGRTEGAVIFLNSSFNDGNFLVNFFIGPYGFIKEKGLAYEMTQLSVYKLGGIIGLFIWCAQFFLFYKLLKNNNLVLKSYKISILVWFLFAFIEGGYWLPPTVINLFCVIGLGFCYQQYLYDDYEKGKKTYETKE